METIDYKTPVTRMDVMNNLIAHSNLDRDTLFSMIMEENEIVEDDEYGRSRRGNIFETLCIILIMTKCFEGLNFTNVYKGFLHEPEVVTDTRDILNVAIGGGGNNCADMVISHVDNPEELIALSVKYWEKYTDGDCDRIEGHTLPTGFKKIVVALIVKNAEVQKSHDHNDKGTTVYKALSKVYDNGLLFDKTNVLNAISIFKTKSDYLSQQNTIKMYEHLNEQYLNNKRILLKLKMHQMMTMNMLDEQIKKKNNMVCIAHKPRSGKSITLLNISKKLIESKTVRRIIIMTSVPSTIDSFIKDIDTYEEFKELDKVQQNDIQQIDPNFIGIVFCSVQFLKTNIKSDPENKRMLINKISPDVIIVDECHHCSSTERTRDNVIGCEEQDDEEQDVLLKEFIKMKNGKKPLIIFASGTPDKTRKFFNIDKEQMFMWELQDELNMKNLMDSTITEIDKTQIISAMNRRHNFKFNECYEDQSLNKDYGNCPLFYKVPYKFPSQLIDKMNDYNNRNNTNFGYSISSLLSLQYDNKTKTYKDQFLICDTTDGGQHLKKQLQHIIPGKPIPGELVSPNRNDIMYRIEQTQSKYNSQMSSVENPKMFIMFLPVNSGNGTISILMKTLKTFIVDENVWDDYNIEYSCSMCDSSPIQEHNETYNLFVRRCMERTKARKNKGCILFLGNAGTVGVTYPDCDVTFSLDDGHSADNHKQKISRALTERPGKTVGISCDLNIHRYYLELHDFIQQIRQDNSKVMTDPECLLYGYKHNLFLFDTDELDKYQDDNGRLGYLESVVKEMYVENPIDDSTILQEIECIDTMRNTLRDTIENKNKSNNMTYTQESQKCPNGNKTILLKHALNTTNVNESIFIIDTENEIEKEIEIEKVNESELENRTKTLLKVAIPMLVLATIGIDMSYNAIIETKYYETVMNDDYLKNVLISLLKSNNGQYKPENIISDINMMLTQMHKKHNAEIIQRVRLAYKNAKPDNIRQMIANHFTPSDIDKTNNAEISTPIILVEQMINSIPDEFWTKPRKVFEPCCGKGNFVLAIFDKFFYGLQKSIKDVRKRCEVIVNECIYYADLTPLNVFIVNELLRHHVAFYTKGGDVELKFNQQVGNTLDMKTTDENGFGTILDAGFDAVISNPPYQDNKGTNATLWDKFVLFSLKSIKPETGYLLFIHPSGWRNIAGNYKKAQKEILKYNLLYLEMHDSKDGKKTFGCGTRYDWYLLIKRAQNKTNTQVMFQDGTVLTTDLNGKEFIPSGGYELFESLIAQKGDENVNIIYSRSLYGSDKAHTSRIKDDEFKYPAIYTISSNNKITYFYSSKKQGHYDVPKLVWTNGSIQTSFTYLDIDGEYALTQFAYAIADNKNDLPNIQKAFDSKRFRDLMEFGAVGQQHINYKIVELFRKDFWKEFI